MSYSIIATLAELAHHMDTHTAASPGLAQRAARLAADDSGRTHLMKLAAGRPLASAHLWAQIADQLGGTAQLDALTVAAQCAMAGGNPGLAATAITRLQVIAARHHHEVPPAIELLTRDHRITEHRHATA
jgi:hypothetical protein